MRRALLALPVLAGVVAAACTTFDFPAPSAAPSDAGPDATLADAPADAAADADAPSRYLDPDDAARLCSLLFQCPRLADAIALSIALPLDFPSSPPGFSSCMDWVAGPIDPNRLGLASQRALLAAVAAATSCAGAGAALPVQPADAGPTCGLTCSDPSDLASCTPDAGTFLLPCQPPYFGQAGACFAADAGAVCLSTGACTAGLSCSADSTALLECIPPSNATFISYSCTLTGRQCTVLGKGGIADCVIPTHNTAPCPLHTPRDACDGTSVLACAGGITAQTEFDCSAVGRTCRVSTAGDARCVGADDACHPYDDNQNVCAGTTISVCIGGSPLTYDCSAIGKTCVAGAAGQTAHCG